MRRLIANELEAGPRLQQDLKLLADLANSAVRLRVFWIGCSDARVTPTDITDADVGELFIVRNVANIVPPEPSGHGSVAAAIDYAIGQLGISHVVICGHTDCKGVEALGRPVDPVTSPHLAAWVEHARPAHRLVHAAAVPEDARSLETVKANVLLQEDHLRGYARVRAALAAGMITLHAWLYDVHAAVLYAYDRDTGEWAAIAKTDD